MQQLRPNIPQVPKAPNIPRLLPRWPLLDLALVPLAFACIYFYSQQFFVPLQLPSFAITFTLVKNTTLGTVPWFSWVGGGGGVWVAHDRIPSGWYPYPMKHLQGIYLYLRMNEEAFVRGQPSGLSLPYSFRFESHPWTLQISGSDQFKWGRPQGSWWEMV